MMNIVLTWISLLLLVDKSLESDQACGAQCEIYEFQCRSTGGCLALRHFCDGIVDCPDGSDEEEIDEGEVGCNNTINEIDKQCKLPNQYKCDGVHHCKNKTDEKDCDRTYQMKCSNIQYCVNKLFLNCRDRDEWTCSDKVACKGGVCTKFFVDTNKECDYTPIFSCKSGECLAPEKFCDGVIDCKDGSDEIIANSTNVGNGVSCSNRWNHVPKNCVLPGRFVCDNIDHCDDRVDECQKGCDSSFICDNGRCLPIKLTVLHACNGRDDCGDGSDELEGPEKCSTFYQCLDGTKMAADVFCNGRKDCADGSDEISPQGAGMGQTICSSIFHPGNLTCVLPDYHVCDRISNCRYAEDELSCNKSNSNNLKYTCNNGTRIIPFTEICDFKDNCCDSSDECDPIHNCKRTFTCKDGSCIAFSLFCDGKYDCPDKSDEETFLPPDGVMCNNPYNNNNSTCALPQEYVCDGEDHCANRADECTDNCTKSFFCADQSCIKKSKFCDGTRDCADGSDEEVSIPGFKCQVKNSLNGASRSCVIRQNDIFDSNYTCSDKSDDCNIPGACFKCASEAFYVASRQVCDNIIDCRDLSDECTCMMHDRNERIKNLCENYCALNDSLLCQNCHSNEIVCDGGNTCISVLQVCDGKKNCNDGSDEIACQSKEETVTGPSLLKNTPCVGWKLGKRTHGIMCDNIPQCEFANDECALIPGTEEFVCGNSTLDICKESGTLPAKNGSLVMPKCPGTIDDYLSTDICNGIEDCAKSEREAVSVDERGCADRFYCHKSQPREPRKINIHITRKCDGIIDCEEEEDEAKELCGEKDRFYCESRKNDANDTKPDPLFVSSHLVMSGKAECWDSSDECPTKLFAQNKFSSHHRMIRNMILSCMVWIMGILAAFGNVVVMGHSISKFRSIRFSQMMKSNYVVVFNLAVADLLMGVYLLSLAIRNAITDGSYCKNDRNWRSSSTCSGLGTLAMVSLQASVSFLVLLTTYRTLTVVNPFKADRIRIRYTLGFVTVIWIVSVLLAIIPRFDVFEDYFVSAVKIPSEVYFFDTDTPSKQQLSKFARVLMAYDKGSPTAFEDDMSWSEIRRVIGERYEESWPKMEFLRKYGYYSAHSVCLPKFFPQVNDRTWGFSVAIMAFDFFSFLYIATAYTIMYKDAARHENLRRDRNAANENKTLQARITRLVLADFLCLVPVCLIAFISASGKEIDPVAYAIAAIVLLPINSALNPIIYSNVLGVLYSFCADPVYTCRAKMLGRKQMTPFVENHPAARQELHSYNYNQFRTSTTTNEDHVMRGDESGLSRSGSGNTNTTSLQSSKL